MTDPSGAQEGLDQVEQAAEQAAQKTASAAAKAAAGGRSPSAADQSGGVAVFLAHPRQITAQGRGHGGHFAAAHSLFPL